MGTTASTTSASPLAQSYANTYSFTDSSWQAGATLGNLEQVTAAGQTVDYDYLADRVVSRSTAPAGPLLEVMVYDRQGRLTSRRTPAGSETEGFAYDVEDQLKQVRRSGAVSEVLECDPLGAVMSARWGPRPTERLAPPPRGAGLSRRAAAVGAGGHRRGHPLHLRGGGSLITYYVVDNAGLAVDRVALGGGVAVSVGVQTLAVSGVAVISVAFGSFLEALGEATYDAFTWTGHVYE